MGAHQRWCSVSVGHAAALRGKLSERIESIADTLGANSPGVTNQLYSAAGELRREAEVLRDEWRAAQ